MTAFIDRLLPAPKTGGFRMDDYWIWCGSPIHAQEDGRYHLFATRSPKTMAFNPFFVTDSEIVRASSDSPIGPYQFEEIVLPPRGEQFWDGKSTFNPAIHQCPKTGTCLLFYAGTTYPGRATRPGSMSDEPFATARANLRTGLATSRSVFGPWARSDHPIVEPRPGRWDGMQNSNPAACVQADGSVILVYKAVGHAKDRFRFGVCRATDFSGPYQRLSDEPILNFDKTGDHVEDPFMWNENGVFQLLMKDMEGGLSGEKHAGIHATSPDALHWSLSSPAKAYSRTVRWDDGSTTVQGSFERPQLLIENGRPTHLFAATADGPGGFWNAKNTWNMVIPLRTV